MPRGRPTKYNPELAAEICDRIASGRTLSAVCRDEDMPKRQTVVEWTLKHKDFSDQYADARRKLLEHWADEVSDIADRGKESPGAVARDRLRVDSRRWLLSKLRPHQYGDRLTVDADVRVNVTADELIAQAAAVGLSPDDLFGR
jgi:hypothetical protein